MDQLQLRPLDIGEIISATFSIGRRRYGTMLMVALVLAGIPFFLSLTGGALGRFGDFIFGIAIAVAAAASIPVAAGAYADIPPDWRGAARFGLQKLGPILGAGIVYGIMLSAGFFVIITLIILASPGSSVESVAIIGLVFWIVPGIILLVSFNWFDAVLMIERTGPMQSLGRSWRLVSGERGRIFLAGLVLFIIAFIIFFIISIIIELVLVFLLSASAGFAIFLSGQIVVLLGVPLVAAFSTVVYLDLRVRKEHLDTEGLAAQLSGGA